MSVYPACFIIMPITTPKEYAEIYRDDLDHFRHVLDHLLIPGVKKAGYEPIIPITTGSALIHAKIIENLQVSDLVLCDMSCLNPNVFFEFGIRTSLNKPICVIRDDKTERIPFDIAIINHLVYQSALNTWEIEEDINKLSDHIKVSVEKCKGENPLWKYFGLKNIVPSLQEIQPEHLCNQSETNTQQVEPKNKIPVSIAKPIKISDRSEIVADLLKRIVSVPWFVEVSINDERNFADVIFNAEYRGVKGDMKLVKAWIKSLCEYGSLYGINIDFRQKF